MNRIEKCKPTKTYYFIFLALCVLRLKHSFSFYSYAYDMIQHVLDTPFNRHINFLNMLEVNEKETLRSLRFIASSSVQSWLPQVFHLEAPAAEYRTKSDERRLLARSKFVYPVGSRWCGLKQVAYTPRVLPLTPAYPQPFAPHDINNRRWRNNSKSFRKTTLKAESIPSARFNC